MQAQDPSVPLIVPLTQAISSEVQSKQESSDPPGIPAQSVVKVSETVCAAPHELDAVTDHV